MEWKMSWTDRLREMLGLNLSQEELARRYFHVKRGGSWPPIPKPIHAPPPLQAPPSESTITARTTETAS